MLRPLREMKTKKRRPAKTIVVAGTHKRCFREPLHERCRSKLFLAHRLSRLSHFYSPAEVYRKRPFMEHRLLAKILPGD